MRKPCREKGPGKQTSPTRLLLAHDVEGYGGLYHVVQDLPEKF